MGIPKFFGWMKKRYPMLDLGVTADEVPPIDNLYLDTNGIIHQCSHPNDDSLVFLNERELFPLILEYIDFLLKFVKPRKVFFIAVDGVAPRAKLNQQRGRRYQTANKVAVNIEKCLSDDTGFNPDDRFDPNCITPGTVFMDRLHKYLYHVIATKVSTDPAWQKCDVVISGLVK